MLGFPSWISMYIVDNPTLYARIRFCLEAYMGVASHSFDDSQDAFAEEIGVSRTHSRLAGVTLPFPRVFASTGPTLTVGCENPVGAICVDSQSSSGLPGSSFTAAIFLVNVTGFIGYDISMNWNQSVLQVTSVLDGNWSTGLSAFTLTNMTSQSTGTVQYSQVLLGNPTNIVNSTLFIVVFKFLGYGSTPVALSSVSLTGLVNGVVSVLPPPTIINGRAFTPPPSSAALIHYKAKAAFKTLAGGSTQTLVADIA